jgi:hypothetical protein
MRWELGGLSVIGVLRMWELCKEEAPAKEAAGSECRNPGLGHLHDD